MTPASQIVTRKQNLFLQCKDNESEEEEQVKMPDIQRDDLTKRKTQSNLSQQQESPMFMKASITQADLETWDRLKMSGETRYVLFYGLNSSMENTLILFESLLS